MILFGHQHSHGIATSCTSSITYRHLLLSPQQFNVEIINTSECLTYGHGLIPDVCRVAY